MVLMYIITQDVIPVQTFFTFFLYIDRYQFVNITMDIIHRPKILSILDFLYKIFSFLKVRLMEEILDEFLKYVDGF